MRDNQQKKLKRKLEGNRVKETPKMHPNPSAKCGNPGLAWPSEPNIVGLARPNIVM